MYPVLPFANDNFSRFPTWMPFISFCVFTTLVRTSSTLLDRSGEGGHSSQVLDLRRISLFIHHLNMICVVEFFVRALYQTEDVSFYY